MIYKIIDNIFISNISYAHDYKLIQENNIKTIFSLSNKSNASLYEKHIDFYNFIIEDNILFNGEIIHFADIIYNYIIYNLNKNILIYSDFGSSRPVSIVMFYLITKYNFTVHDSYKLIKQIKKNAGPNTGFLYVLNKYYNELRKNNFIKTDNIITNIITFEKTKIINYK